MSDGPYYLTFQAPSNHAFTLQSQGSNTTLDSDVSSAGQTANFTLALGQVKTDLDAGLVPYGSISGLVWEDDGDGIQEEGEAVQAGVDVTLYDSSNSSVASVYTDQYGTYQFTNVAPGAYHVTFTPPSNFGFTLQDQGSNDALDSDVNSAGATATFTLALGEDATHVDAGLRPYGAISGWVWQDDGDGIQEEGESGLGGAVVTLRDLQGNVIASTSAASDGTYQFENVAPGEYTLQVMDASWAPTLLDQGSNDTLDSDINTDGITAAFALGLGEWLDDFDAGLVYDV